MNRSGVKGGIRKVIIAGSMVSFLSSFLLMGTMIQSYEYYTGWTGYPTMLFMTCLALAVGSLIVFTDMLVKKNATM